jgi:hypothetical protein
MPGNRDQMRRKAGRNIAIELQHGDAAGSDREVLIPQDADGLQAIRLAVPAGTTTEGVDPAGSGGQYYLVVAGSLVHDDKDLPMWSLLWVDADEPAPVLHAGDSGVELLVMQFPVADATAQPTRSRHAALLEPAGAAAE